MKPKIEINDNIKKNLIRYREMLIEWNKKMNLTAIIDEEEVWIKHFEDSLECVKYIKEGDKVIDVGTGAGFPGLVLAIFFEGKIEMTLMDSLNKRMIFLENVVKELNIKNIKIIHARAEEKANDKEYREVYDVVTSRAVAKLNVLMEYTVPFLKVKGKAIYMKSQNIDEEIKESKNAEKTLKVEFKNKYEYELIVKEETYKRAILEYVKKDFTNPKYPRMYSKIKVKPL